MLERFVTVNGVKFTFDQIRQMDDDRLEDFLSDYRAEALDDGAFAQSEAQTY